MPHMQDMHLITCEQQNKLLFSTFNSKVLLSIADSFHKIKTQGKWERSIISPLKHPDNKDNLPIWKPPETPNTC